MEKKECPKCREELEDVGSGYRCGSLSGFWYYEEKEQKTNLPTEVMEIDISKYKTPQMLKDKYPDGYRGFKLGFIVEEFIPVIRGERKPLHVHVMVKKGNAELLKVKVPSLVVERENKKFKKSDREEWKKLISNNLPDIMAEIKIRLSLKGIRIEEFDIKS